MRPLTLTLRRSPAWTLAVAFGLASLASCADGATSTDASVATDIARDVSTPPNDLGLADVGVDSPREDLGPRDVPPTDVPVDGGILAAIPVDPMGVPAPGSECTSDAGVRAGDPTIAPPRPIVPQSVSRVTSQRPSFRWALPAGTTGARVEVCADRCCTRVIQTLDAEGTTVRPTATLPPGVVYWRMFGRAGGVTGSRASYTWEFEVRRRDTPVDSSWGTIRDFTGDGYDDMLVFAGRGDIAAPATLYMVQGGPGAPQAARIVGTAPMAEKPWVRTGDFNGDGRADIAYRAYRPDSAPSRAMVIIEGAAEGLRVARQINAPTDPRIFFGIPSVTDWDGDGYSDIVVSAYIRIETGVPESALMIYRGAPAGLGSIPQSLSRFRAPIRQRWVTTLGDLGDLDGDGFGEVYAEDREFGVSGYGKFVLHGAGDGALRAVLIPDPPTWIETVRYTGGTQAYSVGDLDADGRGDLVLCPLFGEVVLIYRNAMGFTDPATSLYEQRDAGGVVRGGGFGTYVVGGDLNGDGFADLMISASLSHVETVPGTSFPINSGRMYVYFGQSAGVETAPIWFDRTPPTDPNDYPQGFARDIASPGDLDGDGIDDAAIVDPHRRQVCYVPGSPSVVGGHLSGCPGYSDPWLVAL